MIDKRIDVKMLMTIEPSFAAQIGLEPKPWGILLAETPSGKVALAGVPDNVEMLKDAAPRGERFDLAAKNFPLRRKGWPDDWVDVDESAPLGVRQIPGAPRWEDEHGAV